MRDMNLCDFGLMNDDFVDVFMEKHWRSVINKSICDYFFEAQSKAANPEDIAPIIPTPHHYLINIYRNSLHFVAVVTTEGKLLDEMLDNGFPLAMEINVLKELIKPPNFLRTITDTVTGKSTSVGATLPTGQLSNIPWRRTGVKYTNNEAYFDVIEEIDAIIDKNGTTSEKILSFVPPDGHFRLMSYHIGSNK
nr:hypothetical protein BaRGS_016232 [Batillaria attramentaria]